MTEFSKRSAQGEKFLACGSDCADSFRTDRRQGLIYGAVRDVDSGEVFDWGAASIHFEFCAYCKAGW